MARPRQPERPKLRPIQGRPVPSDLLAERAVLATCLMHPVRFDQVAAMLRSSDFFDERNALVFAAIHELRSEGSAVDTVTVAGRLRDQGKLSAAGGPAYTGTLVDETPSVVNVIEHAELVRRKARQREMIAAFHQRLAEGYDSVSPTWEIEVARSIANIAEVETRSRGAIFEAWKPLPAELLTQDPEPRRWLLRHPTAQWEPCAPGRGDGFIPLEKAGALVSAGGVGKTYAMIQLALSIALSMPWFGHFHVTPEAARGRVCLGLAEETLRDFHERFKPAADAMKLTSEQRERARQRIVALPLFSEPVALLRRGADGNSLVETEEYFALRSRLRDTAVAHGPGCAAYQSPGRRVAFNDCPPTCVHGWSLVVLDPLARWAGDVESDNAAATRFVQLAESLTKVPGGPTVLVVHHSSKDARKTNTVDSRGVTAITDGFRWLGTLRSSSDGILLGQEKSNYSIAMPKELAIKRYRGGFLRVPSEEEEAERQHRAGERKEARDTAHVEASERRIEGAMRDLVFAIRRSKAPFTRRSDLLAQVKWQQRVKSDALSRLMAAGHVQKDEAGYTLVEVQATAPASNEVQLALV